MSLWDALRMNMMISYQELVRTFLTLARHIQRIITSFEPRLDPKTIRVVPVVNERQSYVLAILFDIYGTCSLPGDEMLVNLRIALDYSCGAVHVFD